MDLEEEGTRKADDGVLTRKGAIVLKTQEKLSVSESKVTNRGGRQVGKGREEVLPLGTQILAGRRPLLSASSSFSIGSGWGDTRVCRA